MALVVKDRVKETTTTTGTGTYTVAGAVAGFQSFADALTDADTTWYGCENGTDWEVGLGTWDETAGTIARTQIYASSNSGNAVDWSAGDKNIFVTLPASRLSTTVVYDTIDDLPLTGDVLEGDQAYVAGNNRLYLYNGTGWYNIALVNTTPTLSGNLASYTLATDGTATVVTMTGTDAEGIPLTWSATTSGDTDAATVTNVDNVFTITPSTDSADSGTITVTFKASDGVNIGTASSEFELTFININWKLYAQFSLGTSGTDAQDEYEFVDRSSNAHTISATGSTDLRVGSVSPFRGAGGYSIWIPSGEYMRSDFDGNSNYSAIGTSEDFCIEMFVLMDGTSVSNYRNLFDFNNYLAVRFASNQFEAAKTGTTSFVNLTTKPDIKFGEWIHIAICRKSGTTKWLIDGTEVYSKSSDTHGYDFWQMYLHKGNTDNEVDVPTYYSNIRVVKGDSVYFDSYTRPTAGLTEITGTAALWNSFNYDDAVEGYSAWGSNVSDYGHRIVSVSPFNESEALNDNDIGSASFENNDSYLTVDLSSTLSDGIGSDDDFTFEFWLKNDLKTWNSYAGEVFFFGTGNSNRVVALRCSNRNQFLLYSWNNDITITIPTSAEGPTYWGWVKSGWNHIAIVKNGNNRDLYWNGVRAGGDTNWGSLAITSADLATCKIGSGQNGTMNGELADFAFSMTAKYTSDFTPPTEPIGASGTTLYLPFDSAGIFDKTGTTEVISAGNAQTDTTETKYATTSLQTAAATDYITTQEVIPTGADDLTIEGWFNFDSASGNVYIASHNTTYAGNNNMFQLGLGSGIPAWWIGGSSNKASSGALSADTWYHIAWVKEGTSYEIFVDGTSVHTFTNSNAIKSYQWRIGNAYDGASQGFTGHIENFQILNGIAKYTENFTAPTVEQGITTQVTS